MFLSQLIPNNTKIFRQYLVYWENKYPFQLAYEESNCTGSFLDTLFNCHNMWKEGYLSPYMLYYIHLTRNMFMPHKSQMINWAFHSMYISLQLPLIKDGKNSECIKIIYSTTLYFFINRNIIKNSLLVKLRLLFIPAANKRDLLKHTQVPKEIITNWNSAHNKVNQPYMKQMNKGTAQIVNLKYQIFADEYWWQKICEEWMEFIQ